jgi:polysaccharide pyruvyl transferase WcaK-like protein
MKLSNFFYFRFGKVPVKSLLFLLSPLKMDGMLLKNTRSRMTRIAQWPWDSILYPILRAGALFTGYHRAEQMVQKDQLRVLIVGGYGYGNVGDEAQLAANLQYWKEAAPGCQLTVLTPNPHYTQDIYPSVRVELAPRVSLFGKGLSPYYGSEKIFKRRYFWVAALCLFNACLIRAGLPVVGLSSRQARLLDELKHSDVLFLSGGGYLTGMTLSRLWDNMLLIRLAHALGLPTIMSGQTVGVFKDKVSRSLAKWGLKKAELIYLRDHVDSPKDLAAIGIPSEKINATFDDALFFEAAPEEEVSALLNDCGVALDKPYLVVNAHYWGQQPEDSRVIMKTLAAVLDHIHDELGLQIVFVSMHKSDEAAIEEVMENMQKTCYFPAHEYDPASTVGVIQQARLCLTMKHHPIIFAMAAGIPTVSMSFDDYYWHKNLGAQKLFDQEDFVLICKPEDLFEQIFEAVVSLQTKKDDISNHILEKLARLRPHGGEVINKWLDSLEYK